MGMPAQGHDAGGVEETTASFMVITSRFLSMWAELL